MASYAERMPSALMLGRARTRTRVAALALAIAIGTAPLAPIYAQGEPEQAAALNSPEYKEQIRQALEEYGLGHWTEARVFFSNAHAIAPNARTLRGLALVSFESRRYVETVSYAERAFANSIQPLTPEMQRELRELTDQSRKFVAHVAIVSDPPGAELAIDGQAVVRADDGVILLDAGAHELVASAPGYETHTRTLQLQGGTETRFDIALTPRPVALTPPPSEAPTPAPLAEPAPARGSPSIAPWILIGTSAALAAGGGVLLAIASADKSAVENSKPGTSWSEIRGSYERAPTFFAFGWTLLGVGVAGLAGGVTWKLWLEPRGDRASSAQLRIAPGAIQVTSRF